MKTHFVTLSLCHIRCSGKLLFYHIKCIYLNKQNEDTLFSSTNIAFARGGAHLPIEEERKNNNAKFSGHYVYPRTETVRAHALRSHQLTISQSKGPKMEPHLGSRVPSASQISGKSRNSGQMPKPKFGTFFKMHFVKENRAKVLLFNYTLLAQIHETCSV